MLTFYILPTKGEKQMNQVAEGYVAGSPRREGEFGPGRWWHCMVHAAQDGDDTAWYTQPRTVMTLHGTRSPWRWWHCMVHAASQDAELKQLFQKFGHEETRGPVTWEKLRNQQYCFNWEKFAIVWASTQPIGRTQHTQVKGKLCDLMYWLTGPLWAHFCLEAIITRNFQEKWKMSISLVSSKPYLQ